MTNMAFSAKQSLPQTFRLRRQLSESIIWSILVLHTSYHLVYKFTNCQLFPPQKTTSNTQSSTPQPPQPPLQSSMADWALRPRPPWAPWAPWRGAPKPRWATSWSRTWCTSAGPWRSWSRWDGHGWPSDQPRVLGVLGLRVSKCPIISG